MVEKAMTLKKFYKWKDHVRLEPANGTMDPVLVDPTKHDVSVLGVLVGVIRKCYTSGVNPRRAAFSATAGRILFFQRSNVNRPTLALVVPVAATAVRFPES
jgi:hypothetical protein